MIPSVRRRPRALVSTVPAAPNGARLETAREGSQSGSGREVESPHISWGQDMSFARGLSSGRINCRRARVFRPAQSRALSCPSACGSGATLISMGLSSRRRSDFRRRRRRLARAGLANQAIRPKSGINRSRRTPSSLWAYRGRFRISGWQTTFTQSGGGGHGSGSSQTRRHILPLARRRLSADKLRRNTLTRRDDCAQEPLSAATAARSDSVSAPGRPPPCCRSRASEASSPTTRASDAPPARGQSA